MTPDLILTSLASNLGMFVANVVAAEISKQRGVMEDVRRLKKNHERVAIMIKSAEQKAALLDDDGAKYWLKRVKDHMYEVENIVDLSVIRSERRRHNDVECELVISASSFLAFLIFCGAAPGFGVLPASFSDVSKIRGCLVYLKWPLCCSKDYSLRIYADAIKVLNEDFETILKLPTETKTDDQMVWSYGKTAPDYNADIVGDYVKNDANIIIRLLKDAKNKCPLIAIVGMVGIGKTTLARTIYHSVEAGTGKGKDFEIKLWIRFSNDLSSLIMWSDCRKEGRTRAQLLQLGTEIANKKFLLVVDDVWTDNVLETLLEGPLQQGNRESSRVIITTRHKHVAKRIGASHVHHMKRMNNDDAWRLLCQRASLSQVDKADLEDIGKQIVQKCDGLPLAIRSMGRTLRGKEPTRDDWENACRTAFQDLSPEEQYVINLSFQDLPSHMRQCFIYCSVFPEGFLIEKRYITQHWISEGFIVKKRKSTLEEIAEDCYDELIGRGLLQLEFGLDGMARARMPFIIRSFAKDVSDYENFCTETVTTTNLFEFRRLSIVKNNEINSRHDDGIENGVNNGREVTLTGENNSTSNHINHGGSSTTEYRLENDEANNDSSNEVRNDAKGGDSSLRHGLRNMKCLRTLILHQSRLQDRVLVEDTFKRLTFLRVLDLSEVKSVKVLPDTIGRLQHLRYLNISGTEIRKVPGTIVYLSMLQYLLLINCKLIQTLPSGIERLRNLRRLDISGSGINDIQWSFGKMEELTSVQGFPMGKNGLLSQDCMFPKKLSTLRIEKLEKVLDPLSDNEFPVKKCQLRELELCYGSDSKRPMVQEQLNRFREVLDRFRPHKHLVSLKIENYYGMQYPSWISRFGLPNLQELHLRNCSLCDELPPLGKLPQLKFLAVTGFDRLASLGAELRGNLETKMVAFPRLQHLHIGDMKVLQKWSGLEDQDLPHLQIIRLLGCMKLIGIPDNLQKSTSLTMFEVDTRTMVAVDAMLKGFPEGVVLNVENQWLQAADRSQESLGRTVAPTALPFQEDNISLAEPATHTDDRSINEGVNRLQYVMKEVLTDVIGMLNQFQFDRKEEAVYMVAAFALSFILYLLCVLLSPSFLSFPS